MSRNPPSDFNPDLTPEEMEQLGVLAKQYYGKDPRSANFFKTDASMASWPKEWKHDSAPLGWFEWYKGYAAGKRTDDDERQIQRWKSFKARHLAQLKKADPTLKDLSIQPRRRQALLNWGIAPGVDKNKYLQKVATTLRKHQEESMEQLDKTKGIVLYHSTGSGKTRTFLEAVLRDQKANPDSRSLIITPASLVSNVHKEIDKHNLPLDKSKINVLSYERASNKQNELSDTKHSLIITDEAHKLRNSDTKRVKNLRPIIEAASTRVLPTATINYNHISDMSPLVNIAAGEKVLPEDRKTMEQEFTSKKVITPGFWDRIRGAKPTTVVELSNQDKLKAILRKYVHQYDPLMDESTHGNYPSHTEEVIPVEMSPEQVRTYKYVEGSLPLALRIKVRHNLPMDKKERASLNSFASGVRQVSNSISGYSKVENPEVTPKISTAVQSVEEGYKSDPNYKAVVYSNFLGSGLNEYSKELKKKGIPHNVYVGSIPAKEKDKMVGEYNSGKTPVLLISSSGAEGLDLKGTKTIQILEPHFNKSKIRQVMGRGIRDGSHLALPKNERHVKVEHYLSVLPKPRFRKRDHSIDLYLNKNSDDKDALFEQIKSLLRNNNG